MLFQKQVILLAMVVASIVPAALAGKRRKNKKKCAQAYPRKKYGSGRCDYYGQTLSNLLTCASGPAGTYDKTDFNFNLLRDYAGTILDTAVGVTAICPNDLAFCRLAEMCGCTNCYCESYYYNEVNVKTFLDRKLAATGVTIDQILNYHVSPDGVYTASQLLYGKTINTDAGKPIKSQKAPGSGNSCPQARLRLVDTGRTTYIGCSKSISRYGWTQAHNKHYDLYINGKKSIAHVSKNVLLTTETADKLGLSKGYGYHTPCCANPPCIAP